MNDPVITPEMLASAERTIERFLNGDISEAELRTFAAPSAVEKLVALKAKHGPEDGPARVQLIPPPEGLPL